MKRPSSWILSLALSLLLAAGAWAASSLGTGALTWVYLGSLISGEDQTNNVMRVEGQFTYKGNLSADTQIKASPGFVHTVSCQSNAATPTAGTVILYDNTAESGTQIWRIDVAAVANVYLPPFTTVLDAVATTGLYLGYTTTTQMVCTVTYR